MIGKTFLENVFVISLIDVVVPGLCAAFESSMKTTFSWSGRCSIRTKRMMMRKGMNSP